MGVRRFIYTSASGAVEGHPVPLFNIKGTCAAALERSGMEYVILTPAVFMEIWIGMVVGMGTSIYVVYVRYGRDH